MGKLPLARAIGIQATLEEVEQLSPGITIATVIEQLVDGTRFTFALDANPVKLAEDKKVDGTLQVVEEAAELLVHAGFVLNASHSLQHRVGVVATKFARQVSGRPQGQLVAQVEGHAADAFSGLAGSQGFRWQTEILADAAAEQAEGVGGGAEGGFTNDDTGTVLLVDPLEP